MTEHLFYAYSRKNSNQCELWIVKVRYRLLSFIFYTLGSDDDNTIQVADQSFDEVNTNGSQLGMFITCSVQFF